VDTYESGVKRDLGNTVLLDTERGNIPERIMATYILPEFQFRYSCLLLTIIRKNCKA